MKKTFSLKFLVLSALLMVGNVFAFAQDPTLDQAVGTTLEGNVVTYRVNNATPITVEGEKAYSVTITGLDADGLEALKGTNPTIALQVPITFREKLGEQYYRFYVTEIKEGALGQSFYGYTEISKLEFIAEPGGSATPLVPYSEATNKFTVGNKAFYGCSSMTELKFTPNCSAIGQYAFQNTAITSFTIPKACATIGQYAFYNCKSLLTIDVAEGNTALKTIGNYVFGNSAINTINLTNATKLKELKAKPFMYSLSEVNDVLATITLPASLETIDATVFQNCTFLQQVNGLQATKVETIGDASFLNCRNLTQLDLPNADIVNAPFVGCVKLATLTFPTGYNKEIGKNLAANTNLYGTTDLANAKYTLADQQALTTLLFNGSFRGTIKANSFVGTKNLATLTFTGALEYGATIEAAFTDVTSLATVTFNGVDTWNQLTKDAEKDDKTVAIVANAFKNTGIATLNFGAIKLAYAKAANFTIATGAFSHCANLTGVTFGDFEVRKSDQDAVFEIAGGAFTYNAKLAKVTFGNLTYENSKGVMKIWDDAFATGNEALTEVVFGNIVNSKDNIGYAGTTVIGCDANVSNMLAKGDNEAAVFGANNSLQKVTFGNLEAGLAISAGAFASEGLTDVTFGDIKAAYGLNSGFVIARNAFKGGNVAAKTVKIGSLSDNNGGLGFVIQNNAFAGDKLTTVEFAKGKAIAVNNVTIDERAFQGKSLATVTIGDIKAGKAASSINISTNAFQGGEVTAKNVKIGSITDNGTVTLGITISANAFAGEKLQSVEIGHMTASDITIQDFAFAGNDLATVKIGNMTSASLKITGQKAFANVNEEPTAVLDETITIGEIGAGLTITGAKVFQGPQADGSTLTTTIAKIGGAATIPAGTFIAPGKGTASYTILGDVAAGSAANIAGEAFLGSKENVVTPVNNTTSVKIQGDYKANFDTKTFTNVNDVEVAVDKDGKAKNLGVNTYLRAFSGAKKVTLGNTGGNKVNGATSADAGKIAEVIFLGNVPGAASIENFVSPNVRLINFKNVENKDVKVAAGAVAAGAFKAAADDAAAKGENITVIYREAQTHDEAVNIFARNAFVDAAFDYSTADAAAKAAAEANVVTLYTTTWLKANIFEAADNDQADLDGQKKYVWRLGYSESDVAPGDAIVAKVAKPEGYTYAYGKLFIPKGISGKYKIKSEYDEATDKNAVQVYYGQIDNSNSKIYLYQLPIINDFFWIDATDVDHAFVIRTSKDVTEIKAEPVEEDDADEAQAIEDNDDFYYFGTALAVQNQLRYNPAKVVNQELRSNGEFKDRAVWMMANPATYGFGFTKIDKTSEVNGVPRYMPAKSLYIVGKDGSDVISAARNLTIVFADEETNTTGIETVETAEQNSDAIYNLNGVRVNGAQKGIYIKNGKKYIVK